MTDEWRTRKIPTYDRAPKPDMSVKEIGVVHLNGWDYSYAFGGAVKDAALNACVTGKTLVTAAIEHYLTEIWPTLEVRSIPVRPDVAGWKRARDLLNHQREQRGEPPATQADIEWAADQGRPLEIEMVLIPGWNVLPSKD